MKNTITKKLIIASLLSSSMFAFTPQYVLASENNESETMEETSFEEMESSEASSQDNMEDENKDEDKDEPEIPTDHEELKQLIED